MDYLVSASIAFAIAFISLPVVINVFNSLNLLDIPDRRKIHKVSTPSLGGIPIVSAALLALLIVMPFSELANMKFFIAGVILTFILGIRDDVSSLNARQKLVIQSLAAFLVVHFLGVYLRSFHGFLGLNEIDPIVGKVLSAMLIVVLTNAYNLIDGIDGLAGGIAIFILTFLGIWFFYNGAGSYALFAITMASAILAFMYFNWFPSKIFMGDTGSMVLGFVLSTLMLQFIEINTRATWMPFESAVTMSVSLFILPTYDTLRVFFKRILAGQSPFSPDKNHIHHVLLKIGFNHGKAASILLSFMVFICMIAWALQPLGNNISMGLIVLITIVFGFGLDFWLGRKVKKQKQRRLEGDHLMVSKSA